MNEREPADAAVTRSGLLYAFGAFGVWGVVPAFWHQLDHVALEEKLAHRLVWSALLLAGLAAWRGQLGEVVAVLRDRRRLPWLGLSALLIGANWYVYIDAVATDRVVEASLGYFVNPLVSVLLGALVLRERLRAAQLVAVGVAACGVALLVVRAGVMPWLSLALAGTFGLYGLVRKQAPVSALPGSTVEMGLLCGPAAAFLLARGQAMGGLGLGTDLLLLASGIVTAAPLLWFSEGARRLPLSTIGMVQYVAPCGQLLLGVLVYGEAFDALRLQAFALIWLALGVFTWDLRRRSVPSQG